MVFTVPFEALTAFSLDLYLGSGKMESGVQDFSFTLHCWSCWKLFEWCARAQLQRSNSPALSDLSGTRHHRRSLPFPWMKFLHRHRYLDSWKTIKLYTRNIKILATSLSHILNSTSYWKFCTSRTKVMELRWLYWIKHLCKSSACHWWQ